MRWERYGIFQDLVLFARPQTEGGAFFMDRMETTWQDWMAYQAQGEEPASKPHHPAVRIHAFAAQAYAQWRFCRLQTHQEWAYASSGGGGYNFPWGNQWRETWANTGALGLSEATPVGTFESGRAGDGPFDLIGNVGEWTSSMAVWQHNSWQLLHQTHWSRSVEDDLLLQQAGWQQSRQAHGLSVWQPSWQPMPSVWNPRQWQVAKDSFWFQANMDALGQLRQTPALSCWSPLWLPQPSTWWVGVRAAKLSRMVAGGDFLSQVWRGRPLPQYRRPLESGDAIGLRLVCDPEGLLLALLREQSEPGSQEKLALRRFLRRSGHRSVLLQAWPMVRDLPGHRGPLLAVLQEELRP